MAVKLNHTIVHARDKRASADFYSDILGLPAAVPFGPFLDVQVANEVTLAFIETDQAIQVQHYAFLVSDAEFDQAFGRIRSRKVRYWADPARSREGEINTLFGGRGVYFEDPAGNLLEIITRPYGSSP